MDTSVTLSGQDVFLIEYHLNQKGAKSRSAVIRKALQLLYASTLEEDYAAFGEMDGNGGADPRDSMAGDRVDEPQE
ncbi:hypothetical protein ABZV14_13330 [Streptosporangium canum]|uniref:hypothetical protein n=1 Tax=Streptosporangium canum TaxID=324952 RepID=UPI0033A4714E